MKDVNLSVQSRRHHCGFCIINQAAGPGTAEFVAEAIEVYCKGK